MSETKEKTPAKMFLKAKLAKCVVLASADLVIKVTAGGAASNEFGDVHIGVSLNDVNEKRIRRKMKDLKKGEKEIEGEVKLTRLNLLNAYKAELVEKLESVGVDQEAVKAFEKELKSEDLEHLLR